MESRDASNISDEQQQFPSPKEIVCIYAPRDEPFYQELQTDLTIWQTRGYIRWLKLSAGVDIEQTLLTFVQQADLILLFISSSFLATSLCHKVMGSALLERARRGVPVVPILTRVCDWKESDCRDLKALPENELPIAEWEHQERAYENIRFGLARLIPGISTQSTTLPSRLRLFQARNLPKGYVPRPKAFHDIKSKLLEQRSGQTTAITVALWGAGGFGKTTLALALCHDPEIQAAFPDGILWIELGEQPPQALDLLNGLLASLEIAQMRATTLEEAQERWRTALQDRCSLLVIDDVWQATALEPLLAGGPQCVRLITTRNDPVLPEDVARVWVDAMEPSEAMMVLRRNLPEEIHQAVYKPKLEALMTRLGRWPLLLTLAHGMLTAHVSFGESIADALTTVEEAYQTYGITAFHLGHASERQRTADACLRVSLRHLEEFTRAHYQAAARYQELVVFPGDIPLATLQIFWKTTGKLEPWETRDLCIQLHRLSLLLTCDLGKGTIRLHDVMRNYLEQRAETNIPALHSLFVDASQRELGLKFWADLPPDASYLWQHLIQHLYWAGRGEALQATLTDLRYLMRKALYVSVPALESDFLLASTFSTADTNAPALSIFASLHRTIVRLSHLLWQAQTPAEMGGLLLSHLGWEPTLAAQRLPLKRELPRPFLTAQHPLPSGSSSALLRTLHGHTDSVEGCAVSPDGRFIVSASSDKTLKVWDAATGVERLSFSGHTSAVNDCAVSPDGSFIVSASYNLALKVWDAITGAERLTLSGHTETVWGCAVSPDGRFIVSASSDKTLKVWDAITGAERLTLSGHTDAVVGCAVSPNGRFVVSASYDTTLKVWNTITGAERFTLSGHTNAVTGCAVSPDSSFIVSTSWDNTLKVWDAATGVERRSLISHTSLVYDCAVSPNGRFIVSASLDKTLKVWDITTGAERLSLTGHTDAVRSCTVSPNGRFIVSASYDKTLKVWNTATGAERLTLSGHTDAVTDCVVSPNGRFIVSASSDKTLKVWNTSTRAERLTLSGHTDAVRGCAVSPDGRFIVSASSDKTLKVWDVATGVERLALSGHTSEVCDCAVSPDGRFIVSASSDKTLKVWNTATGSEQLTLSGHTSLVSRCAVSPDGHFIVSSSWDHTLKVWDVATGVERLALSGHTSGVCDCAVSPDGRFIVSASLDKTLKVWDVRTGQRMLTFPMDGGLEGCAFYPDGMHLVVCGVQGVFFLV